jgi:hypothetical protein
VKDLFSHLFIPRSSNNYRAKVLHHRVLVVFLIFFLISPIAASHLKARSILGASLSIFPVELTILTNEERQKNGLIPLRQDKQLAKAAEEKAKDMLTRNYWAHTAPDGTTPWVFIKQAGYEYIYAGENLAKGFNSSGDVVRAWMNSATHRENILSPNFEDVGFAVSEGTLNGENTTLVVQELGGKTLVPVQSKTPKEPQKLEIQKPQTNLNILGIPEAKSINLSQKIAIAMAGSLLVILIFDMLLAYKRKIVRLAGHSLDHILLFLFLIFLLTSLFSGSIL